MNTSVSPIIDRWLFVPSSPERKILDHEKTGTPGKDTLKEKNLPNITTTTLFDPCNVLFFSPYEKAWLYFLKCYRRCTCSILRYACNWTPNLIVSGGPQKVISPLGGLWFHSHISCWFSVSAEFLPTLRSHPHTTPLVSLLITSPFKQLLLIFPKHCLFMACWYISHFMQGLKSWWKFHHSTTHAPII